MDLRSQSKLPDLESIADIERRVKAGQQVSKDEWQLFVEHIQAEPGGSRAEAERQLHKLLAAGWTFEIPHESATEPWQLFWRAPPKRLGKLGRKYLSTNQAFNAFRKAGD